MTIETKFKEGDDIFFIHEAKVIKSIVRGIKIERLPHSLNDVYKTDILYLCNNEPGKSVNLKVPEKIAFPTKEKLLKSL